MPSDVVESCFKCSVAVKKRVYGNFSLSLAHNSKRQRLFIICGKFSGYKSAEIGFGVDLTFDVINTQDCRSKSG